MRVAMTMWIVKGTAAAVVLCLGGMAAPALAADAKTPCLQDQGLLAARPPALSDRAAAKLAAPQTGATPLKQAPKLLPPSGAGATKKAYVLDRDAGTVTFGDGQSGQRPPSGSGDVSATYRAGGGATGQTTGYPCK